jgi:hypothetical protein
LHGGGGSAIGLAQFSSGELLPVAKFNPNRCLFRLSDALLLLLLRLALSQVRG